MNPKVSIVAAGLLALAACTPVGYVKPGVTEEAMARDFRECADIARHQAFRDRPLFGSPFASGHSLRHRHRLSSFDHFQPSQLELEVRYRRVCMFARGYDLVPLEETPKNSYAP